MGVASVKPQKGFEIYGLVEDESQTQPICAYWECCDYVQPVGIVGSCSVVPSLSLFSSLEIPWLLLGMLTGKGVTFGYSSQT